MNRLRITALLAVLAAGTMGAALAQPPAPSGPKVLAVEPVHDFGRVAPGEQVSHDFVLRNDGSAPLLLREVRSDCACSATSYDESIAPGAQGEVRVVLDTTELAGPVARTITVLTNDAATPSITLTLKAAVRPALAIRPGYARYNYVQNESPGIVVQTLYTVDGTDFNVLAVKSPYPYLAASFREATAEERHPDGTGKQWRVETVLSPDSPAGALANWVEITTDHPRQKAARVAISGFVRPVIVVTPAAAELGPRSLAYPQLGSLLVQVNSTAEIAVTKVDTDIEGLGVELKPVAPGRSYKVELTLLPAMARGEFRGKVRVHTASPRMPLLEVPISGRVE